MHGCEASERLAFTAAGATNCRSQPRYSSLAAARTRRLRSFSSAAKAFLTDASSVNFHRQSGIAGAHFCDALEYGNVEKGTAQVRDLLSKYFHSVGSLSGTFDPGQSYNGSRPETNSVIRQQWVREEQRTPAVSRARKGVTPQVRAEDTAVVSCDRGKTVVTTPC